MFKENREDAITKELQQIHDMERFQPKQWDELGESQGSQVPYVHQGEA